MLKLLLRDMLTSRTRLTLSLLAIASVVVLITVFEGFKAGLWTQVRAYPTSLDVPLVAIQAGADGTALSRSVIPEAVAQLLASEPDVNAVTPVLIVHSIFDHEDHKTPVSIVGFEGRGGPARIVSGRNAQARDEAVFDRSLVRKYGLSVGRQVTVLGRRVAVVGVSEGSSSLFGSYIFVSTETLRGLVTSSGTVAESGSAAATLLLLELAPGTPADAARARLSSRSPGVEIVTPSYLGSRDVVAARDVMGSAIRFIVASSYVVGLLVVGLTLYGGVLEREAEFGIVSALGAGSRRLYSYVLLQGVLLSVVGFGLGLAASQGVAALLTRVAPQYLIVVSDFTVIVRTAVALFAIGAVATLFPVFRIASIDPAQVFRR